MKRAGVATSASIVGASTVGLRGESSFDKKTKSQKRRERIQKSPILKSIVPTKQPNRMLGIQSGMQTQVNIDDLSLGIADRLDSIESLLHLFIQQVSCLQIFQQNWVYDDGVYDGVPDDNTGIAGAALEKQCKSVRRLQAFWRKRKIEAAKQNEHHDDALCCDAQTQLLSEVDTPINSEGRDSDALDVVTEQQLQLRKKRVWKPRSSVGVCGSGDSCVAQLQTQISEGLLKDTGIEDTAAGEERLPEEASEAEFSSVRAEFYAMEDRMRKNFKAMCSLSFNQPTGAKLEDRRGDG